VCVKPEELCPQTSVSVSDVVCSREGVAFNMPAINIIRAASIAVTVLASSSAHAAGKGDLIIGTPTIVDGDTFDLGADRIRTWGYDSPERPWLSFIPYNRRCCSRQGEQWCPAQESADALSGCVKGTTVTCRVQKVETRWGKTRYVSECWRDDNKQDIGECMVRSGWGTDFTCYSGGHYLPLESEPKSMKQGLWQCDGDPPTKRWGRGLEL
jgi:endonuclease YncB( thermonuclease family)